MFPDVESRIGKEKDWVIGTYNHTAMESNVTVEWVNVCSGSTQILTVYFYINDIDVTHGAGGGKPLRKSWCFGNFVFTEFLGGKIINGNNADGCTAIMINEKSQIQIFLTISLDQRTYFITRLMHCFLRMESVLDNLVEDGLNVTLLLGELYRNYINRKRQKDALDIAIKEADWVYGTKHGEERNRLCSDACNRIGEVLESMGRFAVAGDIYDNLGDLFNYETKSLYYNAAIAYERGGLYDKAERTFIKSLNGSSPDSNGLINAPVCNSILLNYDMWGRTATGSDETTNVHCTWANLLFYAGMASLSEHIGTYGPAIMKLYGNLRPSPLEKKIPETVRRNQKS
jgi:tetratricopeptide (TPR) repeat protein